MQPAPAVSVDLWLISVDNTDAVNVKDLADREDRSRMNAIARPQRKQHFAFRRLALRYVLARYLPRYSLQVDSQGKPYVSTSGGRQGLRFSVSSSKAVCAVSVSHADTGVDIEVNPPHVDVAAIVGHFMPNLNPAVKPAFAASEAPGETAEERAFRQHQGALGWCRLEAYTKLKGSTLHEMLFSGGPDPVPLLRLDAGHTAVAVCNLDYVCVVAHTQPFRLARVEQIDYARISREHA